MTNEPQPPTRSEGSAQPPLQPPPPPSAPATDSQAFSEEHAHKRCPACAEWMPNEAFVCRMCRYDLRREAFADARPRTNGLAVASLIMGLVALMIFPLIPLSALGGLLALVMGGVARRQIKKSEGAMSGAEMARFGLWLGLVAVLVALGLTIAASVLDVEVIDVNLST
jgi:hypothetical protein